MILPVRTKTDCAPLPTEDAEQVVQRVHSDCLRAAAILGIPLNPPPVLFDLKGSAAGMFCARGRDVWLRFNPWLFANDFVTHLNDTVTHEVAHLGIHRLFRGGRGVRPHGAEWQGLMLALGANPRATFTGDMSNIPMRRQRRFSYVCGCQKHEVSTTRHNRIHRYGTVYRCRYCGENLRQSHAE